MILDDSLRSLPKKIKQFGFDFAIKEALYKKMAIITDYRVDKQQQIVYNYCSSIFDSIKPVPVIASRTDNSDIEKKIPVWVMWWQGYESAPDIVKVCINSQKKYLDKEVFQYNLLTKDNYSQFVTLPEIIISKFNQGKITITHLSDIIRAFLLNQSGGLWMDATILMTDHFPKEFYKYSFYTNKKFTYPNLMRNTVPKGMWTGYFMKGPRHYQLFNFMCAAFEYYWSKFDIIIDYFLIDYVIKYAYDNIALIRSDIDNVPENNKDIFHLGRLLNQPYNEDKVSQITNKTIIHKISRKNPYFDTTDGQQTFYAYLKKKYL